MQSETPKPTEGSEYTFARKQSVASLDRKDLAHIWEISGSQDLAALIAEGDHLFLGPLQVSARLHRVAGRPDCAGTASLNAAAGQHMAAQRGHEPLSAGESPLFHEPLQGRAQHNSTGWLAPCCSSRP